MLLRMISQQRKIFLHDRLGDIELLERAFLLNELFFCFLKKLFAQQKRVGFKAYFKNRLAKPSRGNGSDQHVCIEDNPHENALKYHHLSAGPWLPRREEFFYERIEIFRPRHSGEWILARRSLIALFFLRLSDSLSDFSFSGRRMVNVVFDVHL